MTEPYAWDEQTERTPVDSAGVEFGQIDRPARMCKTQIGEESYLLKNPKAPNGWIRTEDWVELHQHR